MLKPFCAGFLSVRRNHYSSNLAGLGSFPQITNTVISLLIQIGSSFNNSAGRHKALKHSLTCNDDEKWHTGAAFTP